MTSDREIHRQKKKKSLNFGDMMMPLLGVILVVILLLGLKILFFGGKKDTAPSVDFPPAVGQPQALLPETPAGGDSTEPQLPVATSPLPELPSLDDIPAVTVDAMEVTPVQDVPLYPVTNTSSSTAKSTAKAAPAQTRAKATTQPKAVSKTAPAKTTAAKSTAPAKAPSTPKVTAPQGKGYSVQAGSFTSEKSANDVVATMRSAGLSARVERAEVKGRAFFRVFVTGGSTEAEAKATESKIKTLGKFDTLVVKDK